MACSPPPNRPRGRIALAALLLGAGFASTSCGKKGSPPRTESPCVCPTSPVAPDLSTPDTTLAFASRAMARGDFEALSACSTPEGIEHVRRDLLAWNALLADAQTGPRAVARIPSPRDDAEKALYRAGFTGDPAGLLCMLARSEGSAAGQVAVPPPAPGVVRIDTDRTLENGTRRRVVLVLRDGAWRVDRFAL